MKILLPDKFLRLNFSPLSTNAEIFRENYHRQKKIFKK